jgi:porin
VTDGNPNPIKYSYNMGIGGKGVVPGRPHDSFGIGWARTEFSDDFVPFLRDALHPGLDHEDAIELYYNAAVTRWLALTGEREAARRPPAASYRGRQHESPAPLHPDSPPP